MVLSIQYLRAIAALLVVFSHSVWKSIQAGDNSLYWWHEAGALGVDIFFIISGYIMVYITQNMHQQPQGIRIFLKKRFIRIVPLYWFYTLIALAIFLIMPDRVNSSGGSTEVLKSFFLLPLDSNEGYLVNVGWTLHYEFIFYILFSFGLLFSRLKGNIFVASFILFSLFFSIFIEPSKLHYVFKSFIHDIFIEFLLGMLLYFILTQIKTTPWYLALLAIFAGISHFYYLHSGGSFTGVIHIDKGISAFLICFGIIGLESVWKKRECKLLTALGNASYSIYLLHPFILVTVVMVNKKLNGYFSTTEVLILSIISSLVAGYLSYLYIENNLMKMWKKV